MNINLNDVPRMAAVGGITVDNVNSALANALNYLALHGVENDSRNGKVLESPLAVVTHYRYPWQRVIFSPLRNANPFFHFMESLWMLAGREDVEFVAQFNKRMAQYSDNGDTFHGAYGYRWRHHFGFDQLASAVEQLRDDRNTRRVVVAMWSPMDDMGMRSKDLPCNTHVYFDLRGGKLNMTVCNRSNDAVWGAYGANAVHFSYLQQYVAESLQVPMGAYVQFSNNLHVYTDVLPVSKFPDMQLDCEAHNFYAPSAPVALHELGETSEPSHRLLGDDANMGRFKSELRRFLQAPGAPYDYTLPVFGCVAVPMFMAWSTRREGNGAPSNYWISQIEPHDWRIACAMWMSRYQVNLREAKAKRQEDK